MKSIHKKNRLLYQQGYNPSIFIHPLNQCIMKNLIILVLVLLGSNVNGQYDYIPSSPEVELLKNDINSSSNGYTGNGSISIPITTISDNGITVPISITYNTSGIPVASEASWVGLGWNLNYGGVLTREVMGKDDFTFIDNSGVERDGFFSKILANGAPFGFFPDPDYIQSPLENIPEDNSIVKAYRIHDTNNPHDGIDGQEYVLNDDVCYRDTIDYMSDIYTFSFPSGSGKFIINNNGEFIPLTNHNFKIEYISISKSWKITDGHGIQYYYGTNENSKQKKYSQSFVFAGQTEGTPYNISNPSGLSPTENISLESWYLDRVVSPSGGEIDYTYERIQKGIKSIPNFSETLIKSLKNLSLITGSTQSTFQHVKEAILSRLTMDRISITSINSSLGEEITFETRGDERKDLVGGNVLEKVIKKVNGKLVKTAHFGNQNYFESEELAAEYSWPSLLSNYESYNYIFSDRIGENDFLRLKLDSLYFTGSDNSSLPPYIFKYNKETLPPKTSFLTDFWGYANGNKNGGTTNTSSFPKGVYMNYDAINDKCLHSHFNFADKSSSFDYAVASSLKRIKNPLGGIEKYGFELNEFEPKTINELYQMGDDEYDSIDKYITGNDFLIDPLLLDDDFDIYHDEQCHNIIRVDGTGYIGNQSFCQDYSGTLKLVNNQNGEEFTTNLWSTTNTDGTFEVSLSDKSNITQGNFSVYLIGNGCVLGSNDGSYFDISILSQYIGDEQVISKGAGLRIKTRSTDDSNGNILTESRQYSSGKLFAIPSFLSGGFFLQQMGSNFNDEHYNSIVKIWSNSRVPLTNAISENRVGYGTCDIIYSGQGVGYSTKLEYFNKKSVIDGFAEFSKLGLYRFSPLKNGIVLKETTKNQGGLKVSETTNTYETDYHHFDWVWSTTILEDFVLFTSNLTTPPASGCTNTNTFAPEVLFAKIGFVPQWVKLDKSTKRTWGTDGSGPVELKTNYTYNNQNYSIKSQLQGSIGLSKKTEYEYGNDVGFMNQANMVAVPTITKVNSGDGGGSKIVYRQLGDMIVVDKHYTAVDGGGWKEVVGLSYLDTDDPYPDSIKLNTKPLKEALTWGTDDEVGLLKGRKYVDRIWTYEYNDIRLLESSEDHNNIISSYDYDGFQRLKEAKSNNDRISNNTTYQLGLAIGLNNIVSTTLAHSSGGYQTDMELDGVGRTISTSKRGYLDGGGDLIVSQKYDALGRATEINDPTAGGKTTYTYESSPLNRLLKTFPPGSP